MNRPITEVKPRFSAAPISRLPVKYPDSAEIRPAIALQVVLLLSIIKNISFLNLKKPARDLP